MVVDHGPRPPAPHPGRRSQPASQRGAGKGSLLGGGGGEKNRVTAGGEVVVSLEIEGASACQPNGALLPSQIEVPPGRRRGKTTTSSSPAREWLRAISKGPFQRRPRFCNGLFFPRRVSGGEGRGMMGPFRGDGDGLIAIMIARGRRRDARASSSFHFPSRVEWKWSK